MARLTEKHYSYDNIIINNWMLPETGLFMPVSGWNRRKEQRPGWGIRASVREELGGRDPGYIPRLKVEGVTPNFSGRRQRNGWRWHSPDRPPPHDGGIAVGQASSGFLHSFSLNRP